MLEFKVDREKCNQCGKCVADCVPGVIAMDQGYPAMAAEKEPLCYRCQHCFTICPTGAVSILGRRAEDSRPVKGCLPDPDQVETLIKGRRSVRQYLDQNLEPQLMQRLLEVAWHAPTGVNTRQVRFTVIDDKQKLAGFRAEVMAGLGRLVRENALPEAFAFFAEFVRMWEEDGIDVLFRGAPHLVVASVPQTVASPMPDCIIALSYFELFAQSNGVGTVWDGLARIAINDLLPESRVRLGIPEDHLVGCAMAFGKPAVSYARTVQHTPALIHRPL